MPAIKARCICQICVCGRHHCGDTTSQRRNSRKLHVINENVLNEERNQQETETKHKTVRMKDLDGEEEKPAADQEEEEYHDENNNTSKHNRKTWQTSPEQVEELTRSLSRMRNDEHGVRLLERSYQKARSKTLGPNKTTMTRTTTKNKSEPRSKPEQSQPPVVQHAKVIRSANGHANQQEKQRQRKDSFLPPLTGFSDSSASSFSSIVCSSEDCDKIHCICETLKKTRLVEEVQDGHGDGAGDYHYNNGINFINVDDNWIVSRPSRTRPRDNLRLEGPMELQTTFRSTYDRTAAQMLDRSSRGVDHQSPKSKLSTGSGSNKQQQGLYLNTRRSRNQGATPLLKSAKRRPNRNRPKTSLKAGGHGYWNTNNRDAYKNFIIVNGEAQMVGTADGATETGVKLPRMTVAAGAPTKTTTVMTSEEKNRCKFEVDDIPADSEIPMRKSNEQGVKRFEKKSLILKGDGAEELMAEKIMKKVQVKDKVKKSEERLVEIEREEEPETKTGVTGKTQHQVATPKPVDALRDHIKEYGILERNGVRPPEPETPVGRNRTFRRLHETSDSFNVLDIAGISGDSHGQVPIRQAQTKPEPLNAPVAAPEPAPKPFLLPQRVQRHKNQSSLAIGEGPMEWMTTNKATYRNGRLGSAQRKRTAGRRIMKSGRKRNLFRQSSDSIFARPNSNETRETKPEPSIYKEEFGHPPYCPALDIKNGDPKYKFSGEAGGHQYYTK